MRHIKSFSNGNLDADVYYDSDWEEYVVEFSTGGVHIVAANYHTSDKQDAISTAKLHVNRPDNGDGDGGVAANPNPTPAAPDNGDDEVIPCFLGTDGVWRTAYAVVGVTS